DPRVDPAELELHGVRVDDDRRVDGREVRRRARVQVLALDRVQRELHVVGGDRVAVVELHALADVERDRRAFDLPRFGDAGDDLAVVAPLDERVEDVLAVRDTDDVVAQVRVRALNIAPHRDGDAARRTRGRRAGRGR